MAWHCLHPMVWPVSGKSHRVISSVFNAVNGRCRASDVHFVVSLYIIFVLLCVQKLYVRLDDKDEEFQCQLLIS